MSTALLQRLVRQAENEGVTLAEVISRTLSASELDEVQRALEEKLSDGYEPISDFMSGVEVLSLEEIMEGDRPSDQDMVRVLD